jgi:hypothetical protein
MQRYARIDGDKIILLPSPPKHAGRMTASGLQRMGVYAYADDPPEYDPVTQLRIGPVMAFDGDAVTATYQVVSKSAEEMGVVLYAAKAAKLAEIAAARYAAETAGLTINGLTIATDRTSQSLITGAALKATQDATYTCQWKTAQGFVALTAAQIIAIADAVRDHVQGCFDAEATLAEQVKAIEINETTTLAEALEAVDAIVWVLE